MIRLVTLVASAAVMGQDVLTMDSLSPTVCQTDGTTDESISISTDCGNGGAITSMQIELEVASAYSYIGFAPQIVGMTIGETFTMVDFCDGQSSVEETLGLSITLTIDVTDNGYVIDYGTGPIEVECAPFGNGVMDVYGSYDITVNNSLPATVVSAFVVDTSHSMENHIPAAKTIIDGIADLSDKASLVTHTDKPVLTFGWAASGDFCWFAEVPVTTDMSEIKVFDKWVIRSGRDVPEAQLEAIYTTLVVNFPEIPDGSKNELHFFTDSCFHEGNEAPDVLVSRPPEMPVHPFGCATWAYPTVAEVRDLAAKRDVKLVLHFFGDADKSCYDVLTAPTTTTTTPTTTHTTMA